MRMPRALAMSMTMAAGLLVAGVAAAEDEWKEDQSGEKPPPDDHPVKKKKDEEKAKDPNAKPARFLADLKLGPAFVLSGGGATEFSLQLNFGYAVARDVITKDD